MRRLLARAWKDLKGEPSIFWILGFAVFATLYHQLNLSEMTLPEALRLLASFLRPAPP